MIKRTKKYYSVLIIVLALIVGIGAICLVLPSNTFITKLGITSKSNEGTGTIEDPWDISADDGTSNVRAVLSEDGTTLTISGTGDMIYKASVRSEWVNVQKVIIKEGVTNIGGYAFQGCTNLSSVEIPNTVTAIQYNAFEGCVSLTKVIIPEGVKEILYCAFKDCTSLEEVILPNSLQNLGNASFMNCEMLSEINLPIGLQSIGNSVFENCDSLTEIVFSEMPRLTSMGKRMFAECDNLTTVYLEENFEFAWDTDALAEMFLNCTKLEEITLAEGTLVIWSGMFKNCSSLKYIYLPETVVRIEANSFFGCSNLLTVVGRSSNG